MLIGEADTSRDAPCAVGKLVLVELIAECDGQQEHATQDGEMDAHRRDEHEAAAHRPDDVAGERHAEGRDDHGHDQRLHEAQERELEEEVPDVSPEHRINGGSRSVG